MRNLVVISGGTSGLGLELVKLFSKNMRFFQFPEQKNQTLFKM